MIVNQISLKELLRKALLDAFRERTDFKVFLSDKLRININEVVSDKCNLRDTVFEIIEHLESKGRFTEFIQAIQISIRAGDQKNPKLLEFFEIYSPENLYEHEKTKPLDTNINFLLDMYLSYPEIDEVPQKITDQILICIYEEEKIQKATNFMIFIEAMIVYYRYLRIGGLPQEHWLKSKRYLLRSWDCIRQAKQIIKNIESQQDSERLLRKLPNDEFGIEIKNIITLS